MHRLNRIFYSGLFIVLQVCTNLFADEQSQIDFANGLFARNMNVEAADEYKSYLEEFPKGQFSEMALYRLGEVYFSLSKFPESINILAKNLKEYPDGAYQSSALLRKGVAHYQLKQLDEASSTLKSIDSGAASAIGCETDYYLGKVFADKNDFDAAKQLFQKVIRREESNPFKPYARFQLANVLVKLKDYENAAIAFSELAKDDTVPTTLQTEGKFRAAESYDKLGWFESAEKLYAELKDGRYGPRASYAYIWTLYKQNKLDDAIRHANEFNKANPESGFEEGLTYLLGNAYQQKNEHDKALEYYYAISDSDEPSSYSRFVLYKICWSLYLKGDFENAVVRGKHFIEKYPQKNGQFYDAQFIVGDSLFNENNLEESIAYLAMATEKKENTTYYEDALYRLSECYHAAKNPKNASKSFQRFANEFPDSPLASKATFRASESLFAIKDFAGAIPHLKQTLDSEDAKPFHEQATYIIGLAFYNLDKKEDSLNYFKQLSDRFPKSNFIDEALFRSGEIVLHLNNDSVQALEIFRKIVNEHPASAYAAESMKNIIVCHQKMNNLDGSVDNILTLIKGHPETVLAPEIYTWMAEQLSEKEKWAEAIEIYDAYLTHHAPKTDTDPTFFQYAKALHANNQEDVALNYLKPFIADESTSPLKQLALFHSAEIHTQMKNIEKARVAYLTASEMNTSDIAARSRFQLGRLAQNNEEWDVAARHFMRVAILYFHNELSPKALWHAGQSYEKLNEPDQARSAYQELLLDFPKSTFAERSQQQLRALAAKP